jgi:hypothetical protein
MHVRTDTLTKTVTIRVKSLTGSNTGAVWLSLHIADIQQSE